MSDESLFDLQYFDRRQEYSVVFKRLPHWAQAGTISFITWRTADSLPKAALARLNRRRQELLRQHQLDPDADWRQELAKLPSAVGEQLHWEFFSAWDRQLDLAAGACVLREPALSEIVMNSLRHFDNERYILTDAVVMPNHVHLLVAFRDEDSLVTQCTSGKHFTATRINRWLRENATTVMLQNGLQPPSSGEFWQVEQFDRLVRSEEDFCRYRYYIAENPRKVRLAEGCFQCYTRIDR